ncbi:hypothetical protein QR680_009495 [Steinernema hermaphroditum]|uniref:HMG box domain-containing protein n=1 Tax=Steinernema hermaphroditum TaxID=289476 RepID=A0AA39M8Y7_9BILA|nr:hypothetical protein QR680_009495 [Steinernema hermaphroditum]
MPRRKNNSSSAEYDHKNGSAEKLKKKKKKKAPKDKNAPKRPPTAFVSYSMERKVDLEKQHPNIKMSDILKIASQEWKGFSDEIKKAHIERATKEMEIYNQAMAEYKKTDNYREFQKSMEVSDPAVKGGQKERKRKLNEENAPRKRQIRLSDSDLADAMMTAGTSQIRIFSDDFLMYNKEQEKELRHLRRNLKVSTEEENTLQKLIADAEARYNAIRAEIRGEGDSLESTERTVERWEAVLKKALENISLPTDLKQLLSDDFDAFTATLTEYQTGKGHELQQVIAFIRDAVANVSFD